MKSCQRALALLFFGIVGTVSISVVAQDMRDETSSSSGQNEDVSQIIDEAISLFQAGRYKVSIEKFERAYDMVGDANILFNIARCYHLLGDKDNAISYYNRFVYHPDVPDDSKTRAREYLEQLKKAKSEEAPPSAESKEPAAATETAGETTDEPADQTGSPQETVDEKPASKPKVVGWVLVGTGAALAITGGALGGVALGNYKDFESADNVNDKKDFEDKGKSLSLASDILLGVGLATAVTGMILLLVKGRHKKQPSDTVTYTPVATSDGVKMSFTLRF